MVDVSSITVAIQSLRTASDIASALRTADLSLEKAEVKLKLADLIGALADARVSLATTQDLLHERDAEITRLQKALELQDDLVRHHQAYYRKNDSALPSGDPYCSRCWEVDHRAIHLHRTPVGEMHACGQCNVKYDYYRTPFLPPEGPE